MNLNLFGLNIISKRRLSALSAEMEHDGYRRALEDIIKLLQNRRAIYLEPVTVYSPLPANIANCAFLASGVGLTINETRKP